jgi:hypothetical protein
MGRCAVVIWFGSDQRRSATELLVDQATYLLAQELSKGILRTVRRNYLERLIKLRVEVESLPTTAPRPANTGRYFRPR